MKRRIYRVTLLVSDHDDIGERGVIDALENTKYPNWCISPCVMGIERREVDWSDDHPLNRSDTAPEAFKELFSCAASSKS
jgi:hypothetical protein